MKKNVLLTVVLALFAWTGMMAGTGTISDPYTCAEAIAVGKDIPAGTYVVGYIVGGRYDNIDLSKPDQTYGLSIADVATETNVENCVQVNTTSAQEAIWHPNNDASKLGALVIVSGSGNGYGGHPAIENDVTIEFYTAPVVGAPVIADIMPQSGSVFVVNTPFLVSATVTTTDAAGIDSVCLAYGPNSEMLTDTLKLDQDVDTFSMTMYLYEEGAFYGQVIAYGANGLVSMSKAIEIVGSKYPMHIMTTADYQVIVDSVSARGLNTHQYSNNSENYYGASAYGKNFSVADGEYNAMFVTADLAIATALSTITLPLTMSEALLGDTVKVAYKMYGGDASEAQMMFVCSSVAPLAFDALIELPTASMYTAITMDSAAYQLIVDTVNAWGLNTSSYSDNSENYFGAGSKYLNFSAGDGAYNSVFATSDTAIEVGISTVLLPVIAADANVGDTIAVTYGLYQGDAAMGTMTFVCTATAEFVRIIIIDNTPEDPSVLNMVKTDYQLIVDTLNARGMNTHAYPDNSDNYYGSSAYNINFDARAGKWNAKFATSEIAIEEALRTILLPSRRSEAMVDDTVLVNYAIYDGTSQDLSMEFVCTSTDPLTFEYTGELPASLQATQAVDVALYPNPATSSIQLTEAASQVMFISISGRTVLSAQNVAAHTSIDVSSLKAGVYFVKVSNSEGSALTKLIKQ